MTIRTINLFVRLKQMESFIHIFFLDRWPPWFNIYNSHRHDMTINMTKNLKTQKFIIAIIVLIHDCIVLTTSATC